MVRLQTPTRVGSDLFARRRDRRRDAADARDVRIDRGRADTVHVGIDHGRADVAIVRPRTRLSAFIAGCHEDRHAFGRHHGELHLFRSTRRVAAVVVDVVTVLFTDAVADRDHIGSVVVDCLLDFVIDLADAELRPLRRAVAVARLVRDVAEVKQHVRTRRERGGLLRVDLGLTVLGIAPR